MTLIELAERVERAEGADRELGREVLLACGWRKTHRPWFLGPIFHWSSPDGAVGFDDDHFYRHDPTNSINTAMALVPDEEGVGWRISDGAGGPTAEVWRFDYDTGREVYHVGANPTATPALAIVAAALKARAAE